MKPATFNVARYPGMEDRPVVVLQSHMDMVCEKNNGTKHDFDNDPIETIVGLANAACQRHYSFRAIRSEVGKAVFALR